MIEQRQSLFRVHPRVRHAAGIALLVVLAGDLAFNRLFAQLGFPPFYVGEMALVCCAFCVLEWLRPSVLAPLQRSWTFRLIAAFLVYGLLRGALAAGSFGFLALRDSVVAGYALLAFLAPAVLCASAPSSDNADVQEMPSLLTRMLLPASLAAGFWAASIQFNWFENAGAETKVDFLTLAAAVGAWVWLMAALKTAPWRGASGGAADGSRGIAFVAAIALAGALALLVRALPTRTVWLSIVPVGFTFVLAFAHSRQRRKWMLPLAGIVLATGMVLALMRAGPAFSKFSAENQLNANLAFSLDEVEARLKAEPEKHEVLVLNTAIANDDKAVRDRMRSLFDPNAGFDSAEGKLGAHAVKWRAIFWMRCVDYTLANAPVFGVGFGRNLTNLLRNTPAWPMYVDSIRVDPPNRSPHSAHVGIFTRLGLVGFGLWIGILALVFWNGLHACWMQRQRALESGDAASQRRFWDTLTILGVWVMLVWAMSFGVILEGPFGGFWFWTLSGVLAWGGTMTGYPHPK